MPPIITNKEKEIDGCNVSVMWRLPTRSACSVTYTIRYREIKTFMNDSDPGWIVIHNVTNTYHTIPLDCDKEYEIAVTAGSTSGWSTSWRVKTKSGMTVHYVWLRLLLNLKICHCPYWEKNTQFALICLCAAN